jgi:phosphoglycerate dehydrogenase-like enzyme
MCFASVAPGRCRGVAPSRPVCREVTLLVPFTRGPYRSRTATGGARDGARGNTVERLKVVVTDYLSEANVERSVLGPIADVVLLQAANEKEVVERAADADALLVFHNMKLTAASFSRLTRCRTAVRVGVGFDNVDLEAAGRLGIVICNVPDYGTEEVADHAILMLLAIARRLVPCHNGIVAGGWEPRWAFGTPRLRGRTLGLIGCGRIGTATALRARAFGLHVVIYDPYQPAGYEKGLGVERCHHLEQMLPHCDFVSLHCPLTSETRHILNAEALALLPPGAYVINTARGPCIDLDALVTALDSGHVTSAALDVVGHEPLDDERIRTHPRILLTPHTAYYSVEGAEEMRTKAAMEVRRALIGEPVLSPVNLAYLTNPRCMIHARKSSTSRP